PRRSSDLRADVRSHSASDPDRPVWPLQCAPARTAAAVSSTSSTCLPLIHNDEELAHTANSAEECGLWSAYAQFPRKHRFRSSSASEHHLAGFEHAQCP